MCEQDTATEDECAAAIELLLECTNRMPEQSIPGMLDFGLKVNRVMIQPTFLKNPYFLSSKLEGED